MNGEGTIDVVFCSDRMHHVGILPAIRSILANTQRAEAVSFHLTVGAGESSGLLAAIAGVSSDPGSRYEVREFRPTPFLEEYLDASGYAAYAARTSAVMNFSRFYLGEIYPELGKVLYLDPDVIVQGDVAELFALATLERHALAAVRVATFGTWDGGFDRQAMRRRGFELDAPVCNTGVFVADLAKWRAQGLVPAFERWMDDHRRSLDDFVFGTQSIMNLAFYRNVQLLPPEWNVRPLGADATIPEESLERAKVLHWAGERKPWAADGLYKERWERYAPVPERDAARRGSPSRGGRE